MSDPPAPAAPSTAAASSPVVEEGSTTLADVLAGDIDAIRGKSAVIEPAEGEDAPSAPAAALPDNAEAELAAFSEAALSTPEGLLAARTIVETARAAEEKRSRKLDRFDQKLQKRNERLAAEHARAVAEIDGQRRIAAQIHAELQTVRSGNAQQILGALSRLSGVPGHELYEQLTQGILADGKRPEPSAELRAATARADHLESMINELRQGKEREAVELERASKTQTIEQVRAAISAAAANAESYPHLAAGLGDESWTPTEVADMVESIMVSSYERTKTPLDKSRALGILEARLAKRSPGSGTAGRAPPGETSSARSKMAGSPARGAGKGTTITPSVADRSAGSKRELSREERLADIARDPAAMRKLGLGQFLED